MEVTQTVLDKISHENIVNKKLSESYPDLKYTIHLEDKSVFASESIDSVTYVSSVYSRYKNIQSIEQLANICTIEGLTILNVDNLEFAPTSDEKIYAHALLKINEILFSKKCIPDRTVSSIDNLLVNWGGNLVNLQSQASRYNLSNATYKKVSNQIERLLAPPITSFYSKELFGITKQELHYSMYYTAYAINEVFSVFAISEDPLEYVSNDGHTYRILLGTKTGYRDYNARKYILCVNETHPIFNYLDKDHFLIIRHDGLVANRKCEMMVTNRLSLETNYNLLAFYIDPLAVKKHLNNGYFLNADVSASVLKVKTIGIEGSLSHSNLTKYQQYRSVIKKEYDGSEANRAYTNFVSNKNSSLKINNILFTSNSAVYKLGEDIVSIEAEGVSKETLASIDISSQFTIYDIINFYSQYYILSSIIHSDRNEKGLLLEDKSFKLKINDIPISIDLNTRNTRIKINSFLIKKQEIIPVIRRAACMHSLEEYNAFLKNVSNLSLEVRDAIANGVPIKIKYYNSLACNPKIIFQRIDNKFLLKITIKRNKKEEEITLTIPRFVSFLHELQKINKHTDGGWCYVSGGATTKDCTYARQCIIKAIRNFCYTIEDDNTLKPVTEDTIPDTDLNNYFDILLETLTVEEKRSLDLLNDVIKQVGAEEYEYRGTQGYKVTGRSKTEYFVQKNAPFGVFELSTDGYVCIVNKNDSNIGVGYDALVARLLLLSNDSNLHNKVSTLSHHVQRKKDE